MTSLQALDDLGTQDPLMLTFFVRGAKAAIAYFVEQSKNTKMVQ